jgi:hypothetical protein
MMDPRSVVLSTMTFSRKKLRSRNRNSFFYPIEMDFNPKPKGFLSNPKPKSVYPKRLRQK